MPAPNRQISPERQGLYMLGNLLTAAGGISFGLSFVVFLVNFGNFNNFESNAKTCGFLAFGGMALMIVGNIIKGVASQGLAGSGVILDPEQARKDMEPLNRMAGGMMQDTISEVEIVNKLADHLDHEDEAALTPEVKDVVKVRCRACHALNDETARFCNQCGSQL